MTETASLAQENAQNSPLKEQSNPTLTFEGTRSELNPILIKGLLLSLLTFGVYSFWLKASLRRFYASSTKLNGLPFEYKGTGGQLFKGYLLASLIIIPALILLWIPFLLGVPFFGELLAFISFLFLISLIPMAMYLKKHHILSNTNYLSSYGQMKKGQLVSFIFYFWGQMLLNAFSMYIYTPWADKNIAKYMTEKASFGGQDFKFNPGKMSQAKFFFLGYLFLMLLLTFIIYVTATALSLGTPELSAKTLENIPHLNKIIILFYLPAVMFFIVYSIAYTKYCISATRFTQAQAQSSLSISKVMGIFLKGFLLIFLCCILLAVMGAYLYLNLYTPLPFLIILGLIGFFLISFISASFMNFPFYRELINTTKFEGTLELDKLEVSSHKRDKGFGSSLSDAL